MQSKKYRKSGILFYGFAILLLKTPAVALWVSGYYPGWTQYTMAPADIDFGSLTHLIHFSLMPDTDGTLLDSFGLSTAHCQATVGAAHNAGKKVILCIGGAGSGDGFLGATKQPHRSTFIKNIVTRMHTFGYDGIDIDWEPLASADSGQVRPFVLQLRAALDSVTSGLLLTAACGDDFFDPAQCRLWAVLQANMDQINLMTYVMSGPWQGWITWHGSAIYNNGQHFPGNSPRPLPCVDEYVNDFLNAGVPASKLGIGIGFHGDIWEGGSGTSTGGASTLYQSWTTAPTVMSDIYYTDIIDSFYTADRYHYDTMAQAPYLSIDQPGSANDKFISYTDSRAIVAKMGYIGDHNLGGCIIWQLGEDYFGTGNSPLKQAIKSALSAPAAARSGLVQNGAEIEAYPNPFHGEITITLPHAAYTAGIFDIRGRCVFALNSIRDCGAIGERAPVIWHPARSISNGVYEIRVQTGNSVFFKKITRLE